MRTLLMIWLTQLGGARSLALVWLWASVRCRRALPLELMVFGRMAALLFQDGEHLAYARFTLPADALPPGLQLRVRWMALDDKTFVRLG